MSFLRSFLRGLTRKELVPGFLPGLLMVAPLAAGPYSRGIDDPQNAHDAPVPGFIGPHGDGKARLDNGQGGFENPGNFVNPLFFAWGSSWSGYLRSDQQSPYSDPTCALGKVTGDNMDVLALGDLSSSQLANGDPPGTITITFDQPILDLHGADFAVFENGFYSEYTLPDGSVSGQIFGELTYVEVSSDGITFVRFPSTSLTDGSGGAGTIDPTDVHNLTGKHGNAYGQSWGTPFDLAETGLASISHVRLVDIPGDGSFLDSRGEPIHDPWHTFGSGGADIEAVGAISTAMSFPDWPPLQQLPAAQRGPCKDPDDDGRCNLAEYAFATLPSEPDDSPPLQVRNVREENRIVTELVFPRDQRATDLTCELCATGDLSSWTPVARSIAGAPFVAVDGYQLDISETSASGNRSIGVIREVRIRVSPGPPLPNPAAFRIRFSRPP